MQSIYLYCQSVIIIVFALITASYCLDVYMTIDDGRNLFGPLDRNFDLIKDGKLLSFMDDLLLHQDYFDPISECVNKITLKWVHENNSDNNDQIGYRMNYLYSTNTDIVQVFTNVNQSGTVPNVVSDFTLNFDCHQSDEFASKTEYIYINITLESQNTGNELFTIALWIKKRCGQCLGEVLRFIPDLSIYGVSRKPNSCGGCKNWGKCIRLSSGKSHCRCKKGYQGLQCEYPICNPTCINNGKCVSPYKCQCANGYEGIGCDNFVCTPPCQFGGICNSSHQCECNPGYFGRNCGKTHNIRIDITPKYLQTGVSVAAKLHCTAKSEPKATFHWLDAENRQIKPNVDPKYRHFKIFINKGLGYSDLWIYGTKLTDHGAYKCIAQNAYEMATIETFIEVDSSFQSTYNNMGEFTNSGEIPVSGSGDGTT